MRYCSISNLGHSLQVGGSYLAAEVPLVYSTALADRWYDDALRSCKIWIIHIINVNSFHSPWLVALLRLKSSICFIAGQRTWIYSFSKGIGIKENSNSFVQDLNSDLWFHFSMKITIILIAPPMNIQIISEFLFFFSLTLSDHKTLGPCPYTSHYWAYWVKSIYLPNPSSLGRI